MKKVNLILRKCKSLSRQLGRSSSYSSLRSKSTREEVLWSNADNNDSNKQEDDGDGDQTTTIYVGSTRKRYMISSKHLSHPLVNALIEKTKQKHGEEVLVAKCEVVLFDHLLWMLENADPNNLGLDSLEELADLYVF